MFSRGIGVNKPFKSTISVVSINYGASTADASKENIQVHYATRMNVAKRTQKLKAVSLYMTINQGPCTNIVFRK